MNTYKNRLTFLFITSGMVFMVSTSFTDILPAEVDGWKPTEPDGIYNSENLFDYIDGGAEVYRSFNVQKVIARRYSKEGAPDIIVDLFDMGSSEDAFGVYHHDIHEGKEAGIGQNSEFVDNYLSFWKDKYFLSIIAFDDTEETKNALLHLSKKIDKAIPEKGEKPEILKLIPKTNQTHYFHDHFCLNYNYFLAEKNILNLSKETEGILAHYTAESGNKFTILLVKYPSDEKAGEAYKSFIENYLPDADPAGFVQTENSKWTCAKQIKSFFIGIFDSQLKSEAQKFLDEIVNNINTVETY